MKRKKTANSPAYRMTRFLVLAAALTLIACDNDVTVSPTAPEWPEPTIGVRTLHISGNLVAEDGSCLEATVLYDGKELADARVVCSKAPGCARLELEAVTASDSGHHTISFKTLRQSKKVIEYLAEARVLVTREGLSLGGASLDLGSTRTRLRAGEVVTFDVDFVD